MKKQYAIVLICTFILFVLIMDAKTVIAGAKDGIDLCLSTAIPSLFPFFVISTVLNANLLGIQLPGLTQVGRLCHIPAGAESIFLLSCLGGYPVGAKSVEEAYQIGHLDRYSCRRMLGFCNNCGPAFIFGICGGLFTPWFAPWLLWLIQIVSAIITGCLLPTKASVSTRSIDAKQITVISALKQSIRSMAEVCGWIIIFRVILTLANRWLLWNAHPMIAVLLTGMLELTNGCTGLTAVANEPARFLICSCFLSFGGVCVLMQTFSVTSQCGMGWYIPGKLIQTAICFTLSVITGSILYPHSFTLPLLITAPLCIVLIFVAKVTINRKKDSHKQKVVV